jgi:hypothetical protein
LSTVADASERKSYEELSTRRASGGDPTYAAPKGPGKAYTVEQGLALASGGIKGRSFENGKAMYNSVGCAACHATARYSTGRSRRGWRWP